MSNKMECPGCGGYSSSILADYDDGEPCRFCQLPHEAARAIIEARHRSADADLTRKYEEAITRATRAEQDARRARLLVEDVREALDRFEKGPT